MHEVIPGVWHWQAVHPRIRQPVSCHYLSEQRLALDPLMPAAGSAWFRDDGRTGIEKIVLTVRHHGRHSKELADEYGATIHAHEGGLHEFEGRGYTPQPFRAGDELAPGVTVVEFGVICPDDAIVHIATGPGVLAFGDGIINEAGIGFVPDKYIAPDDPDEVHAGSYDRLEQVLAEVGDFDALLFAHGDPIPTDGRRRLEEFVAARA